ncbi:MAG: S-layer homology domain-containing protein, partial [Caldiserica bacterium]|nr:S-layer homology domain-containing protein [Caldisericota bacterium]
KLVFTCYNPGEVPMEYSILAGSTYSQSEAGGWGAPELSGNPKFEDLPHYKTFIVTIARYEKIGVAICRENDGRLGVVKVFEGTSQAAGTKILEVKGLGKVEADLANKKLVFTCYNPGEVPMEYSILAGSTYSQSEAGGWGAPELEPAVKKEVLPHYTTFIVTIARYDKMGIAICRENDGKLAVVKICEGFEEAPSPLMEIEDLGKVQADLANKKLVFTCYNPGEVPIEYSILAGSTYSQSEAGGWGAPELEPAVKKEVLPHYKTFMVAMGRYEKFQVGFGRENDGVLAFYTLAYTPPSPSPTPSPTPSGATITLLNPKGGEVLLAGETYEVQWSVKNSPRIPNQVDIYLSKDNGENWELVGTSTTMGSFSWTIPSSQVTRNALLKVSWVTSLEHSILDEDQSGSFFIIFRDVPLDFWSFHEVMNLAELGIIIGYPDYLFRPENSVTRAEFSKMILLALGLSPKVPQGNVFPDVPTSHWACGYIEAAYEHGLVIGYPDGNFRPEGQITIAEILTVIVRAMGWAPVNPPSTVQILIRVSPDAFRFISTEDWFYKYVGASIVHGILIFPDYEQIASPIGSGDYFIQFNDPATRAQTSVFLSRMLMSTTFR